MVLNWRPVGPQTALTYWQRRAFVLLVLLLVVLFFRSVLGGGGPESVTGPVPTPRPVASAGTETGSTPVSVGGAPAPTSSPGSSSPGAAVAPCEPTDLTITVKSDQASYPVGGRPELQFSVLNTGAEPCVRDLGQAAIELSVFSGTDRIWSSDDCAPGGPKKPTTLSPGTAAVTRLTWSGRRSAPGCAANAPPIQAGTYRVNARVGQLRVDGETFRLTD